MDILRGKPGPDGIKRLEPVEQVGVLGSRDGARQGLVKVMVRVDQPWQQNVPVQVQDFVCRFR